MMPFCRVGRVHENPLTYSGFDQNPTKGIRVHLKAQGLYLTGPLF